MQKVYKCIPQYIVSVWKKVFAVMKKISILEPEQLMTCSIWM